MKGKYIRIGAAASLTSFLLLFGCEKPEMPMEVVENEETVEETSQELIFVEPIIWDTEEETIVEETTSETEEPEDPEDPAAHVKICAIGDMLMHRGVSMQAFKEDGSVNYDFIFDTISDELSDADIGIVNNEVIFGGNELGLLGYPEFNVYTELGDAEVKAGFNVILNASNHTTDQGISGIWNTLEFWKKYPEVQILGIHESEEDRDMIRIIEKNGIKIALFNFTYGLNNEVVPDDMPWLIDKMTDDRKELIARALSDAESQADFTIVCPHWGEEYTLHHNALQEEWAYFFTYYGADLIIGAHPHCLEDVQVIYTENGNSAMCCYSLGNYVGLQDYTVSQLGALACIEIEKTQAGTVITNHKMRFLVNHFNSGYAGPYTYYLEDYTDELAEKHGVNTDDIADPYGFKDQYPLSIQGFSNILQDIGLY